jgi:hypothetical protein
MTFDKRGKKITQGKKHKKIGKISLNFSEGGWKPPPNQLHKDLPSLTQKESFGSDLPLSHCLSVYLSIRLPVCLTATRTSERKSRREPGLQRSQLPGDLFLEILKHET